MAAERVTELFSQFKLLFPLLRSDISVRIHAIIPHLSNPHSMQHQHKISMQ